MKALYVIILYVVIQTVESYLLTPLVQQRTVSLPPALTITAQVLLGILAGGLGIIVATPLTAALLVFVKMLYIEDILGDKQ
jgi:predicted PurR-regulated permease PerM